MLVLERNPFILLHFLYLQDDYISLETLAHLLQVSKSTIQHLLADIDDLLQQELDRPLLHRTSKGIKMPDDKRLLALIDEITCQPILDTYQADERRLFIFAKLLLQGQDLRQKQLAEKLLSSPRTISQDIAHLKLLCQAKNLALTYQRNRGYDIQGSSYAKNLFLVQLFSNLFENRLVFNFIDIEDYLYHLFDQQLALESIQDLSYLLKKHFSPLFNEFDLIKLLVFSLSALMMAKQQNKKEVWQSQKDQSKSLAYLLDHFLEELAQKLAYPVSANLRRDFYTLLLSLPKIPNKQTFLEDYPFEVEILADYLIQEMSKLEKIPFYLDNDLAAIMTDHLISAIKRIETGVQLRNPLKSEIICRYGDLLRKIKTIIAKQRAAILKQLNDDELSYLTLYFASSHEKISHMVEDNYACLLFSHLPNANLRMMRYELSSLFHLKIITVKNEAELKKTLADQTIDLILTTEICQPLTKVPMLTISSLLSQEDKQRIFSMITQYRKKSLGLKTAIQTSDNSPLLKIIDERNCLFQVHYSDLIAAIAKTGDLLEKNGYTNTVHKDLLVDKMKATENINHFMLLPGILFPHIGISTTAYQPALSIITLKQPLVYQGSSIHCILTFCSMDRNVHKEALGELSRLLNKEHIVEKLEQVEKFNDLKKLILE